ncbi:MAG: hypothetical protein ACOYKE_00390 [Ferruginibacter sp.]
MKKQQVAFVLLSFILFTITGCFFFESKGKLLFKEGKYSIRKKNLVSYYNTSPDLFIETPKGAVKINLNGYGTRKIPQEKITTIRLLEITPDSIQLFFSSTDVNAREKAETFMLNTKKLADSVLALKP